MDRQTSHHVLRASPEPGPGERTKLVGSRVIRRTASSVMLLAQCEKCQGFGDGVPKIRRTLQDENEARGLPFSMGIGAVLLAAVFALTTYAQQEPNEPREKRDPVREFFEKLDTEYHGFYEVRAGTRLLDDPYESKDLSIGEARYQFDLLSMRDWGDIKVKGDVYGDFVEEQADFDLREANIFTRPSDSMDLKLGRQVLTWGTGDLIFINDMFPKDWVSFFIGRDTEYLKAPSDAVKVSLFSDAANLDVAYTPEFDSDRYITGERLSYYNPILGRRAGEDNEMMISRRREFFEEDETAIRLYRNVRNYELALYGYWGYWKSPAGFNETLTRATFPELYVYGASIRGTVGKGIANAEFGYYDSLDDRAGDDPLINNSEMRYLIGYTQEVARDFTAGVQYYVEQMLDYGDYEDSRFPGSPSRDEFRHVTTLRLTKLLMNQNLMLSLFTYYSPSDADVYMRPLVNYKVSDHLMYEVGSNVFFGDDEHTFFNQFHNNTNLYCGVRYSF
ncbi:MAG: hypothetical protein ABFD90_04160 [Phycisphaerales bacterium]